jgi:type VI secretion system protein ImpM
MPAGETLCGFYGKVPARGDFVSRRLDKGFVDVWDPWLQQGLAASRGSLGEAWLELYLNGPVWRFVLSAGVVGPDGVAGIMMPSVDKVGRYFPLTIATTVAAGVTPFAVAAQGGTWFARAEDLALGCLEEPFDFEIFDQQVAALGAPVAPAPGGPEDAGPGDQAVVTFAEGTPFEAVEGSLADRIALVAWSRYSLWWTEGALRMPAMARAFPALPASEAFAQLLSCDADPGAEPGDREAAVEGG